MIAVDENKCNGCGLCARECPLQAIEIKDRLAHSMSACAHCLLCVRLCPRGAINKQSSDGRLKCSNCPVECEITEGYWGACRRYKNAGGSLIRESPLIVTERPGVREETSILEPLLTGIGSGTTAPCHVPAPYIVQEYSAGVDVVTVVSEVPLSYSGMKLKIDTNEFIGDEGSLVRREGRIIGRVTTEEYGSKMLTLGGVNILHGETGSTAARTMVDLVNRETVRLKVDKGSVLELQVGAPPLINGKPADKMRVGCGSATIAMFAPYFKGVADEVIVLDPGITGLFSEHQAGRAVGMSWSGITPCGTKSTIGRYFGKLGPGLGGTDVPDAHSAVVAVDMNIARPGMKILVTDTSGETAAMLRITVDGQWEEIPVSSGALQVVGLIRGNCEESRVSALLMCGVGGSARAGVCKNPIKLTRAVRAGTIRVTVAGQPVFLLPGGGITFAVDVAQLPAGSIMWVPTPALVVPVEYTLPLDVYRSIDGHVERIQPLSKIMKTQSIKNIKEWVANDRN